MSSYQTAWTMLARLRCVTTSSGSTPLAGHVEVDESLFGGHRAGSRGRGALGKTLVAGAIEITGSGWGRARLQVIPDASAKSLQRFIQQNILPGATVSTDAWTAYPNALAGYVHEPVNIAASGLQAHESLPVSIRRL
ncbi:IS1595 family transposase [Leucobacter sp. HY1910]